MSESTKVCLVAEALIAFPNGINVQENRQNKVCFLSSCQQKLIYQRPKDPKTQKTNKQKQLQI